MRRIAVVLALLSIPCQGLLGCGSKEPIVQVVPDKTHEAPAPAAVTTLSIIGTNDLHGHIEMLPILGGFLRIIREPDDRGVLLVDGGDLFQGTLASNLKEGAPIIEAYNLLGYVASTIGNHEFDFGPVGPDATVQHDGQDPRGALKARAAAASFPFLSANIFDNTTEKAIDWPNVKPSLLTDIRGVKVGIVGISTYDTPHVTLPANFVGLSMAPLAAQVEKYAKELREGGAKAIVVIAHAGGMCKDFSDPLDLSTCKAEEIMDVADALPPGTVDVIVAGHTHLGMAHQVNGIAIIESYSRGKAFGRVDLSVASDGTVALKKIYPPQSLCAEGKGPTCSPGEYEGQSVQTDQGLKALADAAGEVAEAIRAQDLSVTLPDPITRSRGEASALGNLFTDLMRAAHPGADIAITNGGSLRAELPAGPLNYGALFEAMPFDNRFALVSIKASTLRKLFAANLGRDNGMLSVSGLQIQARCRRHQIDVTLRRENGKAIPDSALLTVATSDFLASGGDGLIGSPGLEPESVTLDGGALIRDAMAEQLKKRGGQLNVGDFFDASKPRIRFTGPRPMHCE